MANFLLIGKLVILKKVNIFWITGNLTKKYDHYDSSEFANMWSHTSDGRRANVMKY